MTYDEIVASMVRAAQAAISEAYRKGIEDGMEAQRRVDEVGRRHGRENQ